MSLLNFHLYREAFPKVPRENRNASPTSGTFHPPYLAISLVRDQRELVNKYRMDERRTPTPQSCEDIKCLELFLAHTKDP